MKAVSESQERDENPTNWIAHETPTNWIALSLDSSLKHYCQMLKALIHPHPLLASLTRAGVSCLLPPQTRRRRPRGGDLKVKVSSKKTLLRILEASSAQTSGNVFSGVLDAPRWTSELITAVASWGCCQTLHDGSGGSGGSGSALLCQPRPMRLVVPRLSAVYAGVWVTMILARWWEPDREGKPSAFPGCALPGSGGVASGVVRCLLGEVLAVTGNASSTVSLSGHDEPDLKQLHTHGMYGTSASVIIVWAFAHWCLHHSDSCGGRPAAVGFAMAVKVKCIAVACSISERASDLLNFKAAGALNFSCWLRSRRVERVTYSRPEYVTVLCGCSPECFICSEPFCVSGDVSGDVRSEDPHGHTPCESCLAAILRTAHVPAAPCRNQKALTCPVCRTITPVPRGQVANLPKNFSLLQCIDLKER